MLSRDRILTNLKLMEIQIHFAKDLAHHLFQYPEKFPDAKTLNTEVDTDEKINVDSKNSLDEINKEYRVLCQ